MSRRPRGMLLVSAVLGAVVLSSAGPCAAEAPAPRSNAPSPNVRLGFPVIGVISRSYHGADGHKDLEEGMGQYVGASLAYVQPLLPYFSLVGLARWTSEGTAWSDETGESRSRLDVAIAPEFGASVKSKPPVRATLRASVPVGPTYAWLSPSQQVGSVRHEYSSGFGLNIGIIAGFDLVWSHSGFYTELAALRHLTTFEHTATLVADPSVTSRDTYNYDQTSVGIGLGYIYRF